MTAFHYWWVFSNNEHQSRRHQCWSAELGQGKAILRVAFAINTTWYNILIPFLPVYDGTESVVSKGSFRFGAALAWTSIFPYACFMVQSFGETSKANTAFFVGLLIAVFTFGEFLGGTVWAGVSNRIGRKPTLLIGWLVP